MYHVIPIASHQTQHPSIPAPSHPTCKGEQLHDFRYLCFACPGALVEIAEYFFNVLACVDALPAAKHKESKKKHNPVANYAVFA
jgi:hypothetical protein